MRSIVQYFANRPVITNVLMFGLIGVAILFWKQIGKEEMPEFAMEWVRVSVRYPGASAEDVELFVTKPIEEKLKGITGLDEISNTSSYGTSSFRISFEARISNLQEKIQEVKDAVSSAELPREVEDPVYRQFRSSEKAIIDIGIFLTDKELLNVRERAVLQKYVLAFKNKILSLPEVSGVEWQGYLRPELQVKVNPKKLEEYEISMNQVRDQVIEKHVRRPIGSLEDKGESDVTIISELDDIPALENVIVSSGFEGQKVKLSELARVGHGFEKSNSIHKIQGREGVILNIQKGSNFDIITAQKAILKFVDTFKAANSEIPLGVILLDDESFDVRNRLSLIGTNGLIGFILIVLVLFLFLDFRSGVWVAMGIPFSLAFTLVMTFVIGYTVNNMTLAAIIVVLGVVVDDAIIVAENIVRRKSNGESASAVESTMKVVSPILASVLTTCAAFIPLFFFSGRFGLFVKYLPVIIFFMLGASLLESFFILPSHMIQKFFWEDWSSKHSLVNRLTEHRKKLTTKIEEAYFRLIRKLLNKRIYVFCGFAILLLVSGYIFSSHLKYVMFPREESKDFRVKVVASEGITRFEMAKKIKAVEDVFITHKHVVGVLSSIGQSRHGGEVKENEASIRVEVVPPTERDISLNDLFKIWQSQLDKLEGFEQIRLLKSRWGSESGSPIVIEVQESKDSDRLEIVNRLKKDLSQIPDLANVEIERPVTKNEYKLRIRTEEASKLGVNYGQLATVLRSYVEGDILYTLNSGEEEVDVRFTSDTSSKDDINDLLNLTVANENNYLVPIRGIVELLPGEKPANIQRTDYKRTTTIYADMAISSKKTPLEVAQQLEGELFSRATVGFPSASILFRGEVEDSRESQSEFLLSIILVLVIIYVLLIFLFNSLWTPLLIGAIIPFGLVGTTLAFWSHGLSQYGFFAVVGTLGMIGVVINDSIVLIDKMKETIEVVGQSLNDLFDQISAASASRLRAVVVTTITTVAGVFPTAYGLGGYDSMLAEMMLAMGWGLLFGMFITLLLVPCLYSIYIQIKLRFSRVAE